MSLSPQLDLIVCLPVVTHPFTLSLFSMSASLSTSNAQCHAESPTPETRCLSNTRHPEEFAKQAHIRIKRKIMAYRGGI